MIRRRLLPTIAAVLALLAVVPVLRAQQQPEWKPKAGLPLTEPQQVHSRNGVLKVTLDARRRAIDVSGSRIRAQPFNNRLIGPTLHVRPGDTLDVTIRNATSERTNIHYHGMHVSPRGRSDNVFRVFHPGQTVKSIVHVPEGHSPGTYWYHVHVLRFTGYYVFHCHILNHEDGGQMKTVQVIRKGQKPSPPAGGGHEHHAR